MLSVDQAGCQQKAIVSLYQSASAAPSQNIHTSFFSNGDNYTAEVKGTATLIANKDL